MGLFGKLLDATVEVVTAPLAVVEDVFDAATGGCDDETHTEKKAKRILNKAGKVIDSATGCDF